MLCFHLLLFCSLQSDSRGIQLKTFSNMSALESHIEVKTSLLHHTHVPREALIRIPACSAKQFISQKIIHMYIYMHIQHFISFFSTSNTKQTYASQRIV